MPNNARKLSVELNRSPGCGSWQKRRLRPLMSSPLTPATHRASFAIGDEHAARRITDVLEEIFFEGQAAVAAF